MEKISLILVVALSVTVCVSAFPRYPHSPSANRFSGWTVTSQELLALPSNHDSANIVRVAPPAGFRHHHISRRSIMFPVRIIPDSYAYLPGNTMEFEP